MQGYFLICQVNGKVKQYHRNKKMAKMDEFIVKISSNLTIDIKKSKNVIHETGAEKLKVGEFLYKSPISAQTKRIKV